jgi:GH18 family chitinase
MAPVIADENVPLLNELIEQKASVSDLKVIIAVGGWDFSYVIAKQRKNTWH